MSTPTIDLARELAEAGERLSESIHDSLLVADQLRSRWERQAIERHMEQQFSRRMIG